MKLAALYSGGKDSTYAIYIAKKYHEITCLISINSKNKESYMFHTPAFEIIKKQAECLDIPLILQETTGEKEKELDDLKIAIKKAIEEYKIEGIITGAVASTYQASRIQKICNELNITCFNPLWQKDQIELLNELVENKFEVIIVGIFAYPFDEKWLMKKIDSEVIKELLKLKEKFKINPAGEGGEIETIVLNSPIHKRKLEITDYDIEYNNHSGFVRIKCIR